MEPRKPETAALSLVAAIAVTLAATHASARPACDLLRQCAAELADEMATGRGSGCGQIWPAATIMQYRRVSTTNFESAEGTVNICDPMFQVIANNTRQFYETRGLCNMPISCKPENYGDLPALPSP